MPGWKFPELPCLGSRFGADAVGGEQPLRTLVLSSGASSELLSAGAVELGSCEAPEDFVEVLVWDERDEEVEVFARICANTPADGALDPVLVDEGRRKAACCRIRRTCVSERGVLLWLQLHGQMYPQRTSPELLEFPWCNANRHKHNFDF